MWVEIKNLIELPAYTLCSHLGRNVEVTLRVILGDGEEIEGAVIPAAGGGPR